MVEYYTKRVDRKRLARSMRDKLLKGHSAN